MSVPLNLYARRFGRLTGICRLESTKCGGARWLWACDCGVRKDIIASNVVRGLVRSCGCLNAERITKHGFAGTVTYRCWVAMKARADGVGRRNKKYYADRGIAVCSRWRESFGNFLSDMGECPPGLTLDRKDNDLGYTPENCRWATRSEQSANTRRTHHVIVDGEEMCLAHACKKTGIRYRTAMRRISRGMTPQQSIEP